MSEDNPLNYIVRVSDNSYSIQVRDSSENLGGYFSYPLKVVDKNSDDFPSFYQFLTQHDHCSRYVYYDYYNDHSFYIFPSSEIIIDSLVFDNFHKLFNYYVKTDFFTDFSNKSPLDDKTLYHFNDDHFAMYDPHAFVFFFEIENLLNISSVSSFDDSTNSFIEEDYQFSEENLSDKLIDSLNSFDSFLKQFFSESDTISDTLSSLEAQLSEQHDMKRISSTKIPVKNIPICEHYTFVSEDFNIVSDNYGFSNQIKHFPICSNPLKKGSINFCLFSYNSQNSCEIYSSSFKDIASYSNNDVTYSMNYFKSIDSHVFNIFLNNSLLVMRYVYSLSDANFEDSLAASLVFFKDFINEFHEDFALTNFTDSLPEKSDFDLSKNFFVHLVNS
jgi:hypothetical protein